MENNEKIPVTQETPAEKLSDREVMQHTAAVWKYRSIEDNGTELHSESHYKYHQTSLAEIIGGRVRGKKHKHEGTNCDDWFETARAENCIIAAVSDGAGSKQLSRIGARASCEAAVEYLKKEIPALFEKNGELLAQLSSDISGDSFLAACGSFAAAVRGAAAAAFNAQIDCLKSFYSDSNYISSLGRNPKLSDLGCTFLLAVIVPLEIDGERQSFVITLQIGDGCICAVNSGCDAEQCFKLLGEADSGTYSGETDFLSEKNISEEVIGRKIRISRGKSDIIMLMSDGVADDYFPANPMMKRLYLDLTLNGILPCAGEYDEPLPPEPIKFPSLKPEQEEVAVQYAKQISEDVNELWERRNTLKGCSLSAWGYSLGENPGERLTAWLDNYIQRGSFDDRTLVIINLGANQGV